MSLLAGSSLVLLIAGADIPPDALQTISTKYQGAVEQAFQAHCADCHGAMPASLAEPARSTAGSKSRKAHKKFSIETGFPFTSRWDLPKLMTEIRKSTADEDMPPKKYMRQKGVAISDAERAAITDWARDAEALLKSPR
jgi:mono/diheme cytochrome c family protein